MKKKDNYSVVNNQEDEDGYTLYPENAIPFENIKQKQDLNSHINVSNPEPDPAKLQTRGSILLLPKF